MKTIYAALALGSALVATAAGAAPYGPVTPPSGMDEVITVTAPKPHERQRSSIGAPIVNVSLSREVRFDDLDLRSDRGARELRSRVRHTARALCRQLESQYLVTDDDAYPCTSSAVNGAMQQADEAIESARS